MPSRGFVSENGVTRNSGVRTLWLWIILWFVNGTFIWWWALNCTNHPPWTSWFEEVKFIRYFSNFKIPSWNLGTYLFASKTPASSAAWWLCSTMWRLAVINGKIGAKEIWPTKMQYPEAQCKCGTCSDQISAIIFTWTMVSVNSLHLDPAPTLNLSI